MSRRRRTVAEVLAVLDELAAAHPERVDRRAKVDGMACRYTEHGECSCLAAHILHRLGVSIGKLKELDQMSFGEPITLDGSDLGGRFTRAAWELLLALQCLNDRGESWGAAAAKVRDPDAHIGRRWSMFVPQDGSPPRPTLGAVGRPWMEEE